MNELELSGIDEPTLSSPTSSLTLRRLIVRRSKCGKSQSIMLLGIPVVDTAPVGVAVAMRGIAMSRRMSCMVEG